MKNKSNKDLLKKEELINQIEMQARDATGSGIYIIRSFKPLVESIFILKKSNDKVTKAIKKFEKSTNKTSNSMMWIAVATGFVGLVQLILAFIH